MGVVDKLNQIKSCKEDIKQAIIDKGVDMTDVAFTEYATKIREISGGSTPEVDDTDYVELTNLGNVNNQAEGGWGRIITMGLATEGVWFDTSLNNFIGNGNYLQLDIWSPDGGLYTGTYTASAPGSMSGSEMNDWEFNIGYDIVDWEVYNWGTCWFEVAEFSTTALGKVTDGTITVLVENDNLILKLKSSTVNARFTKAISELPFTVINNGGGGEEPSTPADFDYLAYRNNMTEYSNAEVYGIAEYVFAGCPNLSTVDLPNIPNIPNGAFMNCGNLASVNVPYSHTVGYNAFQNCGALTEINLPVCYSVCDTAFFNTALTAIDLPECTDIGQQAFASLFNLASVNIPKCKRLGYGAFQNAAITAIDLPMCESLGDYTFSYCGNLATADLPVCMGIGASAFDGDTALTTVYAPLCTNIGWNAFAWSALSDLDVSKIYWCNLGSTEAFNGTPLANGEGTIKVHKSSLERYQSDFAWSAFADRFVGVGEDDVVLLAFDNGRMYGDTTILGMTYATYLGIDAMSSLTEIDLPNCSMFETDQWGNGVNFAWFGNLQTVKLPSMTSIGFNVFTMCQSLTTVDIANCTNIGQYAFQNCTALTTVNSPECREISDTAFQGCGNLNSIDLSKCTYIAGYAFDGCVCLTAIDLPECTYIGNNAFMNCGGLTTINLPKCGFISPSAFEECNNLKTITVGTGLEVEYGQMCFIDGTAFMNCTALEAIFVPASQVDAYKTTSGWDMYADKIFAVE